jgi:RNA polymerase sigma-70 factor, ECF subfamily
LFGNRKQKQFETMFAPHLDSVFNLARYLCGSAHDAEDIVQEAYLRAYRAFDTYNGNNNRAWIMTITRNTCYSWMRRYAFKHASLSDGALYDGKDALMADENCAPDSILQTAEDRFRVQQAIAKLPMEFREVLMLREFEQMSYREIGDVLHVPIGTVMSRLARARKRLKALLVDSDGGEIL